MAARYFLQAFLQAHSCNSAIAELLQRPPAEVFLWRIDFDLATREGMICSLDLFTEAVLPLL
jgi:hypothetical protein